VTEAVAPVHVRAQAKWVRTSARKARVVLEHIRGRSVPEARTVLAFTQRAAAREIDRVLRSAVANAESAHALDGDELLVVAAYADEGPTLKRWRARARGRAGRIQKRTCHITIVVAEDPALTSGRPRRAQQPADDVAPAPEIEEGGIEEGDTEAPEAVETPTRKEEARA
jgi:large subunit ribosomal protein L22